MLDIDRILGRRGRQPTGPHAAAPDAPASQPAYHQPEPPTQADPIFGRRRSDRPPTCRPDGSRRRCGRHLWLELVSGIACARCERPADMAEVVQYIAGLEFADPHPAGLALGRSRESPD